MSLMLSSVAFLYVVLFVLSVCSLTFAAPTQKTQVKDVTEDNSSSQYILSALLQLVDMEDIEDINGGQKHSRVKRSGKFEEASNMTPTKVMQLFFTFFRNIVTSDPIGGKHPMSRSIPGPVVKLFKQTIIKTMFPNLSKDH